MTLPQGRMPKNRRLWTKAQIAELNDTPMEELVPLHFLTLKSGWDRFSYFRLEELRHLVPVRSLFMAEKAIDDERWLSICLRWMIRGLDADKAIRKVQLDIEEEQKQATEYGMRRQIHVPRGWK